MKNVVFIVMDSVFEEILNANDNVCPFINSIRGNSLYFSNVYSQGPYTEAGTKGLLCSEDTLDNEAYLHRYSNAKNFISSIFKDNGYKTTSLIYPTTLYNKKIIEKLDNIFFSSVFLPDVFWNQKLLFYKSVKEENGLDESDYVRIFGILEDVFDFWLYSLDRKEHPDNFKMLDEYNSGFPWEDLYRSVENEREKYQYDKKAYVDSLLLSNNNFLQTKTFAETDILKNNALKKAIKKRRAFCLKLSFFQLFREVKNLNLLFSLTKKEKSKSERKKLRKAWLTSVKRAFDIFTVKKSKDFKLLLSAGAQLDFAADYLINNQKEPQFLMVHIEEPHYYNTFFSYDCEDIDKIVGEFDYADEYLRSVKKTGYSGFAYYDLSLRYVDLQIKKLFDKLKANGALENTIVVLTSDHGSSYTGRFIRPRSVINFHKENYHIPFIIYGDSISGKTVDKLSSNLDIIPTLLKFLNLSSPTDLSGKDILSTEARDHILIEFMGAGCPDIHLKPAWIAAKSNYCQVSYIGSVLKEFKCDNIDAVYDLKEDPDQYNNLKGRNTGIEAERLIGCIKARLEQLRKEYSSE